MNKPRRHCIFCDNLVDSKEHIWSQWMHDLLEGNLHGKYDRTTINREPDGREEISGPKGKPGNVFDIQVRAVCRSCNQGWMNAREQEVRPFLEPMIKGDPLSITADQLLALAKWCAQKFVVMEHSAIGTAVTPRADCVRLKNEGRIPPYFRIYVGNHVSKSRSAAIRHSHTLALSKKGPIPPLGEADRNIETISLVMGKLFLHLNAARVHDFEIESAIFVSRVWDENRIWPNPNSSLTWPHRPLLDNNGLSLIGNILENIARSPKVRWIEKPVKK